ncbi:MAG: glycosyl hydrolase family 92 [Bacteroidetes bacterium MedPE-SWsnd-G2]|nr:MAG: glycosyl hydrolase family 92 [Bacteroidetes bacterium MedPE-SWsnd-G2]
MATKLSILLIALLTLSSCADSSKPNSSSNNTPLISHVNPFIGTGGHGHTFPGATAPFGMMQLSPDTRLDGWDGCSGYHYSDNYIYGFSHTHLSGTGVSDYGDILLMPTNSINFNNGADGESGYGDTFSHENEIAEPGYYSVQLDSTQIKVELTVSERSGIHRYKYPTSDQQYLILELDHRDQLLDYKIEQVDSFSIKGFRHSKAWATKQMLFYDIEFSHPIKNIYYNEDGTVISKNYKFLSQQAAIQFINPKNEPIIVKVGISAVDNKGAMQNRIEEIGSTNFEAQKKKVQNSWENQLKKIVVESKDETIMANFYSAMYHSMIAPNLYQDIDGRYRGMDLEIHQTKDFNYYTVFSLWDTYRATHPLYTIIEQERTSDFINTFLAKYDEGGIMPIWDLSANYTGCMIGYHAVPVIADAYLKGIKGYDEEKAFQAMTHSAVQDKLGLKSYKALGYIPVEEESESVSKTLEYAYDDWTIAQMAKAMNKTDAYKTYTERAQNYKNIFDPNSKFMRGRFRNTWFAPFDPYEVNFNYTEANAWQYSFYVPQDITGFTNLLGGKDQLNAQLDTLFSANAETSGRNQADITGLIGQYAHGNEPSHHMAYLYNFANKPYKTQEKVHEILTGLYHNLPDGVSGNEDCGQMSSWYVFSALGFYPVTPGSNNYIIGTPIIENATINLENGKQFSVSTSNLSSSNIYIQSATLNGEPLEHSFISHEAIINGGTLHFNMGAAPSNWATSDTNAPKTSIEDHLIVAAPFIEKGDVAFKGSTDVVLKTVHPKAEIYYKLGDSEFQLFNAPITISTPTTLSTFAKHRDAKSKIITTEFYKIDPNLSVALSTSYANQYNGGGENALIDGIKGTIDFRTGTWQGYFDENLIATVDLGKEKPINTIQINFLQDQKSWIFYPTRVECYASVDGINFDFISNEQIKADEKSEEITIKTSTFKVKNGKRYRYVKLMAKKLGVLPEWHLGFEHDGRSWLFADEISIN